MEVLVSFVEMGGYGGPAFGLTLVVLLALLVVSLRALRAREATLQTLQEQDEENGTRLRRRVRA
jgi:heme exporter protein D